jgi:hypothetical protein
MDSKERKMVTVKQVKAALTHHVDSVGKRKDGAVIVRRGYFYRNGMDCDKFAEIVQHHLTRGGVDATVTEKGDIWKPFRGGATVAQGSHFFAVIA